MIKKELSSAGPLRVALYIRVSGEEQKIKGLSLEAQQERLEEYARNQGWIVVGTYIDAAKTARKDMRKRSEFQKMINSVKRDEIDLLLFCRLDRWFRSVADYYKIMEILQAHHCDWKTIDEEYDTSTANGRLYINVKLSIAQNEADICSERISVVFDSKVQHCTVVSGNCPFGYVVNEEKRLAIDPDAAAIVRDAFNYYESSVSQRGTIRHIRETYGVNWCDATFRRMLSERLYTGVYDSNKRFNENFCDPIIDAAQFDRVQKLLKKNARFSPAGNIYIFTSILKCAECLHNLSGCRTRSGNRYYYYYRCNQHLQRGRCPHNNSVREDYIESWLFEHLQEELERCRLEWEIRAAERKKKNRSNDKAVLKRKLTKLKELYMNDLINIEEYKKDYQLYTAALQQIPDEAPEETPPDFSAVERMLQADFRNIYDSLTREEKRTLWRSVISEIRVDRDNNITGIIFG